MYIPLSFMGGTGVVASCNCNILGFQLAINPGQFIDLAFQPCNGEQIETIRFTTSIQSSDICVGDRNFNFSGTGQVSNSNLNGLCLQDDCQSCDCYEYFYQVSVDQPGAFIEYIPCNVPYSSRETIGLLAPLSTGSFICSFPWMVRTVFSGSLDFPPNGPTGVIKQVNSASCPIQFPTASLQVGDLAGGGMILFVTGSYPNQNGLIIATASVATSSVNMSRWGYLGTITGINNQAYGTGASNTAALRNYIPNTGSIAAHAMTGSINGYNDWFLPSLGEVIATKLNHIEWPVQLLPQQFLNQRLQGQPQLNIMIGTGGQSKILTSNEKADGTLAQRRQFAKTARTLTFAFDPDIDKNKTGDAFYAYRYFTSSFV